MLALQNGTPSSAVSKPHTANVNSKEVFLAISFNFYRFWMVYNTHCIVFEPHQAEDAIQTHFFFHFPDSVTTVGRLSQDGHLFDTIGGNCPRFTKFFRNCRTLWRLELRILRSVTFPEFRKETCSNPIQRRIWTYGRSRLRFRIVPISSVTDRQLPKEHAERLQGSAAACRLSRDEL